MPYRKIPIVAGEIYHVFNRSIAKLPIFKTNSDYVRTTKVVEFYRFKKLPIRFSYFKRLPDDLKKDFINSYMQDENKTLEIMSYCIMPNHVHFLIKQLKFGGISNFMRNFQNSYSKYFNTKYKRAGSLFQAMFKAVRIESDEQLIHVSRYIHLNPTTSFIINPQQLEKYPWSSLKDYLSKQHQSFISTEQILSYFKSRGAYKKFVKDNLDYQQKLDEIKHLILE